MSENDVNEKQGFQNPEAESTSYEQTHSSKSGVLNHNDNPELITNGQETLSEPAANCQENLPELVESHPENLSESVANSQETLSAPNDDNQEKNMESATNCQETNKAFASMKEKKKFYVVVSNGLFTSFCWQPCKRRHLLSYFKRIIYICFPFVLTTLLAISIYNSKSYVKMNDFYSFSDDRTSTFTVLFLFFFAYFMNGLYLFLFNKTLSQCFDDILFDTDKKMQKHLAKFCYFITLCSFIASIILSSFFIRRAQNIGGSSYWYSKISTFGFITYCLIIVITIYSVIRLCFLILAYSIAICIASIRVENKERSIKQMRQNLYRKASLCNYLSIALGISVCMVLSAIIILYSDYNAWDNFKIELTNLDVTFILVLSLILATTFEVGTILLSLFTVWSSIKKDEEKIDITSRGGDDLKIRRHTALYFFLTAFFPGLAALLQIVKPLSEIIEQIAALF